MVCGLCVSGKFGWGGKFGLAGWKVLIEWKVWFDECLCVVAAWVGSLAGVESLAWQGGKFGFMGDYRITCLSHI